MDPSVELNRALLLNAGYEPLRVVSWQRAFRLIFQGKVEILEEYEDTLIRTVTSYYNIPAVLKLKTWVRLRRWAPVIRFSRSNLYARDEWKCQYCYIRFSERELTLDHVIPVARGGKKTWENIVTACLRCNQKKGHRSLDSAAMRLLKLPKPPRWIPGMMGTIKTKYPPSVWEPYLISEKK